MNVLLLTDKLITGGAEYYFCKLENDLQSPDITFFSAAAGGELITRLKHSDRYIPITRQQHLKNLRQLRKRIIDHEIDLIHANSLRMVLYSIMLKKLLNRPLKLIYTKHNVTYLEKKKPLIFRRLLKNYVDKIITVSNFEKHNLTSLGIPPEQIETIYNGVDLKRFKFKSKQEKSVKKVGILARLSVEKNHRLFLEIAKECEKNPLLQFYIAGDGPEEESIVSMISQLNLFDKVKLVGRVNQPEKFISEMDILLLTSHLEVFPMVIIEAMAVGTLIISIDRGGIGEAIVDGETGFLIANPEASLFSKRIHSLALDSQVNHRIIHEARAKAESEYSAEQMVDKTLQQYLIYQSEKSLC
ncbi:glycosyltransferase family 4 protein [Bacillus sp. 2205SS5-2]|uniref:glycosyltransferase family 4 protein n=1 Tax=Bacillus sp. 2205SS5-2 TaxID=3109031 RepID=UPI0030054ECC